MYKHCLLGLLVFSSSIFPANQNIHPSNEALAGYLSFIQFKTKNDFSKDENRNIFDDDKKLTSRIHSLNEGYEEIGYGLFRNWSEAQRIKIDEILNSVIQPIDTIDKVSKQAENLLATIESNRFLLNSSSMGLTGINNGLRAWNKAYPAYDIHFQRFTNGDNGMSVRPIRNRIPSQSVKISHYMTSFFEVFRLGSLIFKSKQEDKIIDRHEQICNVILKGVDLIVLNQDLINSSKK